MRSQNIKHNQFGKIGGTSCLLLLLLTFLTINPIISLSVFAEEIPESEAKEIPDEANVPAPQVDTPSTISISFSPISGSASLSPTTSAGQSAQIKVLATINVRESGGYSVYVKSNSQNLVGQKSSANIIPGIQGGATYANLPTNSWGYYAAEGDTVPDSAVYKAISTTGYGDKIAENTNSKITSDTKTIALSFATKINDEKPADTYQSTVTMSVVSSPLEIVNDFGIATMQEMTSAVCNAAADNDNDGQVSAQLEDTRDGKYYWVSKLADGKCWMTQNLDLDLSTNKALTPADSDVASNWTPAYATATVVNNSTILANNTGQRSWSLGDYRITNPTVSNDCGYPKNDASQCATQFTTYTTPTTTNGDKLAHYILGNHYQWNAATAGTGGMIVSGEANGSICPAGWKLPASGTITAGSFAALITSYNLGSDVAKLANYPLAFVRGGYISQDNMLFAYAGNNGYYWSSTPNSNNIKAFGLVFSGSTKDYINGTDNYDRKYGFSVRCIAR